MGRKAILDWVEETARRDRLHELDSLLDQLEQLNLKDSNQLTSQLRERLAAIGVSAPSRANVTELIERVWEVQEQYLQAGGQEGVKSVH